MSDRTLKRLLAALGALVLLYVLVLVSGRSRGGGVAGGSEMARLVDAVEESRIGAVRLVGPSDTLEIERAGSAWTVNGYPVDSAAISRFWRAMEETEVTGLAASNPANHPRLGVARDSAWSLVLVRSGSEDFELLLGKSGPRFRTAYARLPEADEVFLLEGDLRGAAARPLRDWRDKTVVRVDTAAVLELLLHREGEDANLRREERGWSVGGALADSIRVASLLGELARVLATGFAPDTAVFPDEVVRRLVAIGEPGDTLAFVDMVEQDGSFLVRNRGGDTVFQLSSWLADRLVPRPEDLVSGGESG